MSAASDRRVAIVTGGGGGIGAAIAAELARLGDHVVTVDPLVSVDGSEQLPAPEHTTAGRITAAGGSATASTASVTDREAVRDLVDEVIAAHGRIDAVVNVAGITRPTGFARGDESDWSAVLSVHLGGYLNVLDAVLPHMAAAGRGHVVGVTSGSGWRAADAGAYSCAKRTVASLTWQLGRAAPGGVAVNAISPIAATRMVAAALGRAGPTAAAAGPSGGSGGAGGGWAGGGGAPTGGLSLGSMPEPEHLAPFAAWLAGHGGPTVRGQVLFTGGSEVAVVDPPRLLEVVRTSGVASVGDVVAGFLGTLDAAEAAQATSGGSNPRVAGLFDTDAADPRTGPAPATLVVSDRPGLARAVVDALGGGAGCSVVAADTIPDGFDAARDVLADTAERLGGLDVVVRAVAAPADGAGGDRWQQVLSSHAGAPQQVLADAAWARAAADHAAACDHPLRLVTLTDATTPGGRSRAQAAAQLSRAARRATRERVSAVAVAMEGSDATSAAALVAALATGSHPGLDGAELVVGDGWVGLRRHPAPAGSVVFGGPELPGWFGDVVGELCR